MKTSTDVRKCLLRNCQHVHTPQLYCLQCHHVNEALVQVGDVLLAPGHVLQPQTSGDLLGLGVTGCAQEAPGQGAVTLLHLKADHRCLVGGGVHVEDGGAAMGKLNIEHASVGV